MYPHPLILTVSFRVVEGFGPMKPRQPAGAHFQRPGANSISSSAREKMRRAQDFSAPSQAD